MSFRVPDSLQMETIFFVVFTFWRVTGLMLVGMALFKLGVFSAKRPSSLYWTLIAVGLLIGIPVTLYGTYRDFAAGWDFLYSFFYGTQFNYWASLLVSLGWVGAIMLASKAAALVPLTRRLAAVGRMAFTNYIMHTVVCTTLFYGHGLGLIGKVSRVEQFAIVLVIWAVQLVSVSDLVALLLVWAARMVVAIANLPAMGTTPSQFRGWTDCSHPRNLRLKSPVWGVFHDVMASLGELHCGLSASWTPAKSWRTRRASDFIHTTAHRVRQKLVQGHSRDSQRIGRETRGGRCP